MKSLFKIFPTLLFVTFVHAAYEDHFPVYYEYCSGTQWKLQGQEPGGSPGHGFTYIHGLCKDYRSAYPQVIPCSEVSTELKKKYPHDGVGISLDKNFSNVMWVAVPGRDLMFTGNKESKPISIAEVNEHLQKITDLKVFDKVISKAEMLLNIEPETSEYLLRIAESTLGTDHAVSWARELHCVKIPATEKSLVNAANFLNESNNQYKTGPGYLWSKFSNNCVHLSINTAHAMGISEKIEVDQKNLKMLTNMALPANAFLMLADQNVLTNKPSIRALKKVLPQTGFYPTQVGSLMNTYAAFPSGEMFDNDELNVLTGPRVLKPFKLLTTPRKYQRKYMTEQNSQLKANAELWVARYEDLLSHLKPNKGHMEVERYLQKQLEIANNILRDQD